MKSYVIVVPGWPSSRYPGRMPFLRDFANGVSEKRETIVIVLESVGGAVRRRDFFEFSKIKHDKNYRLWKVPIINIRITFLMRFQQYMWGYFFAIVLKRTNITVVNSHFNEVSYFGQKLSNLLKTKHIITEHASNFFCSLPKSRISKAKIRSVFNNADTVVAVGPKLAKDISHFTSIKASRIHIIGNGIDIEAVRDASMNLIHSNNEKSFIFVGHLIDRKRILQLIKVFGALKVDVPVTLNIIGDGPLLPEVLSLTRLLTTPSHCFRYLGQLEKAEVMNHISGSDFLVLPSQFESFGIVAAEALTLGTPCIVSKCGGPEHYVRPGIDGFHFEVDDFDALQDLMTQAANGALGLLREDIFKKNENRFSWQTIVQKYLDLEE